MSGTLFGIGPMELLMIAVLILLVFGPERVPSLMRDLGRNVRKLRQYYVAFSTELKREMEPFQQDIKGIQDAAKDLQEDLNAIRQAADIRGIISAQDLEPAKPELAKPVAAQTIAPPAAKAPAVNTPAVQTPAANGNGVASASCIPEPVGAPVAVATAEATPDGTMAPATASTAAPTVAPIATTSPVVVHNVAVELSDDNPWAQSAHEPRSDKLDDDNPWAS